MNREQIVFLSMGSALYIACSLVAALVDHLALVLLFGPTKSLAYAFHGFVRLMEPNSNLSDSNLYIGGGVILHSVCWMLFPVVLFWSTKRGFSRLASGMVAVGVAWLTGVPLNFAWAVLSTM